VGDASKKKKWGGLAVALIAGGVIAWAAIALLGSGDGGGLAHTTPARASFPPGGPAEFLYLDKARIIAYLAQIDDGEESSKKYAQKLTDSLNGKVNLESIAEAGGSRSEEDVVEKVVTPSGASLFFDLKRALEEEEEESEGEEGDTHYLEPVDLENPESGVETVGEGHFIEFQASELLSPAYLDQYLAIKRPHGVRDLFPPDGAGEAAARNTPARWATWRFKGELGKDPRVDLAVRVDEPDGKGRIVYLLPVDGALLTEEQSLLSHHGGTLTVVGKIIRLWPDPGKQKVKTPVYVDNATRATWEGPVRSAPGELVCRTNPACRTKVAANGIRGPHRQTLIEESRKAELRALHVETRIQRRGAVVLPIAIYK
jgi:hypothetical protein